MSTTDIATDTADPTNVETQTSAVRVALLGGEVQTVEFDGATTVGDVLKQADISVGNGQIITMNGQTADINDIAEPGSAIVVTGRVKNG